MAIQVGPSVSGNYPATPIFNALVPREGPKMIPYPVAFPTAASFLVDLEQTISQRFMSVVQTLFIDASLCTAPVTIQIEGTLIEIVAEQTTQGYYPVLVPRIPRFVISSTSTQPAVVAFINVPIPSTIWHVAPASLSVSFPTAAAAPGAGDVPILSAQAGGVTNWTNVSGITGASARSTRWTPR